MNCINDDRPISPHIKFKTLEKIKEQEYVSDQAYLVPENGGTAVYISYELNKALEQIFHTYAISGFMGVSEFNRMCIECNILPKSTKKDTICYIFKQANSMNTGYVDFKGFFQVLHRLSCYAFRKLIMTEQEKFNVLIKHLSIIKNQKTKLHHAFSVGVQVSVDKTDVSTNTFCEKHDVACNTSIEKQDKGCNTDPIETVKKEVKDVEGKNTVSGESKIKKKGFEDIEIKNKIEEIERISTDKEKLNKQLKEEINKALTIINNKNEELENLQKEHEELLNTKNAEIEKLDNEIEQLSNTKKEIEEKKNELENGIDAKLKENEKKEEQEKIDNTNFINLKKTLILFGEEEGELFKIFFNYSSYDADVAEYTMDRKRCASFLAFYYLLRDKEKNKQIINLTAKDAASLFEEAIKDMNKFQKNIPERSTLNYFYFKLLLSKIGNFLYPDLSERESFLEIISRHILFVHANKIYLSKKGSSEIKDTLLTNLKKIPKFRKPDISKDFDVFSEKVKGEYTSSTEEDIISKHNILKKKKKEITGMPFQKRHNEPVYHRDSSFEYIYSNELNMANNLKHNNTLTNVPPHQTSNIEKRKSYAIKQNNSHIKNFLNKNIKYNKYGYDMSSDDYASITSLSSDYVKIVPQKNQHTKNIITSKNNQKNLYPNVNFPTQLQNSSKLIHLKKDADYPNDFNKFNGFKTGTENNVAKDNRQFFDLEGTVWSPKVGKKEYFLAKFGNE